MPPFVVYVTYPSSMKEYAYLADFPVKQGDIVLGNGNAQVEVRRTAASDPSAWKYVRPLPDARKKALEVRNEVIEALFKQEQRRLVMLEMMRAVAKSSPRMRRLIQEYRANADEIANL